MKKAAYGLLAAFLAYWAHGAIPTTAEGWYTPSGGWTAQSGTGTIYYDYDRNTGVWKTTTVTVDDEGNIITGGIADFGRNYELRTACEALEKALKNTATLLNHKEAIESIGKNLHDLTSKSGIKITNPETGRSYTIKFGSGTIGEAASGASGDIPATTDMDDPADLKSLNWTDSSASAKIQLYGWGSQAATGSLWGVYSTPVAIPVRPAVGAKVEYQNWYGVDRLSLSPDDSTHQLELKGWRTEGSDVMTPLAEAIKKTTKGTFDDYELVVRNGSKGLNYVSLGTLDMGGEADGVTIAEVGDEKKLSLAGWDYGAKGPLFLANVGGAPAYLPVEGGGSGCGCTNAWASLAKWIGDGTEAGGTNGLDFANTALAGAVAVKGFHNAVDGKTLESAYDKDAGTNTVGIKGFADGAACGASLTAMLAATNSVDAAGHLLLTRHSSGDLHYLPLGAAEFDRLGPTLKFVGTDPENVAVVPGSSETNTVTFASASDSNVKVTVERDGANGVKVTFGVYYK